MPLHHTTIATPPGPLTILADDQGRVHAAGFHVDAELLLRVVAPGEAARARADLGAVTAAVRGYVDGDVEAVRRIPVQEPLLAAFQLAVWRELRAVPAGETVTYAKLATAAGRPAAVRAAAGACARNPVALFVPCHRVVRGDRSGGAYRWGLETKQWLLAHERRVTAGDSPVARSA